MDIKNTILKYKHIYNLPELKYRENVSDIFLKTCKKNHYFAIIAIYNLKKEVLLIRDLNKAIGWELPGGYINNDENFENAVNRITFNETGLEIDELTPVAIIKNIFNCNKKSFTHYGIAFMALSRGDAELYPNNFQSHFTNKTPQKMAYQNDKIFSIAMNKLKTLTLNPPLEEIDSMKNKRFYLSHVFHKYFIKRIGNLSSRKIKKVLFEIIEGNPQSILDASCGESSLISELYERYKPDICIGNDISWKALTMVKNKNPSVIFTNHDVTKLPYKIKFDLVIFKNTLHHIEKSHQKELLKNLRDLSKQLIIIDIEDPQHSTLRSKLWNDYYVYLLGDQGEDFLTFQEFKHLVNFQNVETGIINTIKGKYFYSSIINQ